MNAFTKELRGLSFEHLDEEIQKFINFLEVSNIQTKGPLVTRMIGTTIHEDGEITLDYNIYVQTVRELRLDGFAFYPEVVAENCLYTHFEGTQEEFGFVENKMSLYIWENDLIELGDVFTVHLEQRENWLVADVFKPLEKMNETL
ncbi:hypothetical protein SAMN02745116_02339 [Pilibacter termitis]|uniref:Uncharacterized protein n=1 Tax=Pilibacter termitis TaxID=263852 RepID=A0A1T4QVF5_9ENTE|nr:hypothetical protein SAMN02745116_02339 [Pilibacter termitis]